MSQSNQHYISIEAVLQREGRTLLQIAIATIWAPALCRYGCKVELEGACEHGLPLRTQGIDDPGLWLE